MAKSISNKELTPRQVHLLELKNFWQSMEDVELLGRTGELLEELRQTAAESLRQNPPDLDGAKAATAQAIFILRSDNF